MIDLEAIRERQRRFACFCWEPNGPNNEGHHPECMSSDINTDVRDLLAEVERFREALMEIAKIRYGIELSDTAEGRIDYWSSLAMQYRTIARSALDDE